MSEKDFLDEWVPHIIENMKKEGKLPLQTFSTCSNAKQTQFCFFRLCYHI